MRSVPEVDYRVLSALAGREEPVPVPALAEELGLDQAPVTAVCLTRPEWIEVLQESALELRLGRKGAGRPFPERQVIQVLREGPKELPEVAAATGLDPGEIGGSLRFMKAKGWVRQEGRTLHLEPPGREALDRPGPDEALVERLAAGPAAAADLRAEGLDVDRALELLKGRTGLVEERERTLRRARLTAAGRAAVAEGLQPRRQVNRLTAEMLLSGEWREADLRPYDVTLESRPAWPGKEHPLVSIFEQTRRVFLEMGFEEAVSPYCESSFWDFDALFQPQDHPARDMQDTFYVARPARCHLPQEDLVEAVRRTHEDGGDTGSVGWRYPWSRDLAERPVLRTHTTATTIRALARDPRAPRKVFSVGPVFRRETVDYKHLPVFHQVDGIIIDEDASLANLLGTLEAFYRKMGFDRFQFRPAFFPYTEPSVEVFVWSERKRDWVEMGGSGIFRPEVTRPFGCTAPVLAWGLGLERLAMFRYDLGSIGELYRARMSWLKETPLCR